MKTQEEWEELARSILIGNIDFAVLNDKYGSFSEGAKAMFDNLLYRAANNYHGNPRVNEQCRAENSLIKSWAADALEEVSPEDYAEWYTITELLDQVSVLKAENERLKKLQKPGWFDKRKWFRL